MSKSSRSAKSKPQLGAEVKNQPVKKTHYQILEVKKNCTEKELKESYKKLALKWHPDRNPDNIEVAEAKFKEIQDAYETLLDPAKRLKYDLNDSPKMRTGTTQSSRFSNPANNSKATYNKVDEELISQAQWEEFQKEEDKRLIDEVENHRKTWPKELQWLCLSRLTYKNYKNLLKLIKNTKLHLDDLIYERGYPLLELLDDDFTSWLLGHDGPSPRDLLNEFYQGEEEILREENISSRMKGNELRCSRFKLFLIRKMLGEAHPFNCIVLDNMPLTEMKRKIFDQCVSGIFPVSRIKKITQIFENKLVGSYLLDIYNFLITPARTKIKQLRDENNPLSLQKAKQLECFIWRTLEMSLYLVRRKHYVDEFSSDSVLIRDMHEIFVRLYKNNMELNLIDKRQNIIKDILRGLLGAFLAAVTFGVVFASSRYVPYFFYSKSRAVMEVGLGQIERAYQRRNMSKRI